VAPSRPWRDRRANSLRGRRARAPSHNSPPRREGGISASRRGKEKLFSSFPDGGAQFSRDVVALRRRCPGPPMWGHGFFLSDWVVALRRHNRLRASLCRGGTVIFSLHRVAAGRGHGDVQVPVQPLLRRLRTLWCGGQTLAMAAALTMVSGRAVVSRHTYGAASSRAERAFVSRRLLRSTLGCGVAHRRQRAGLSVLPPGRSSRAARYSQSSGSHPPGAAHALRNFGRSCGTVFYVLAADLGSGRLRRPRAPCIQQPHRHPRSGSELGWACVSGYNILILSFDDGWVS